MNKNFWGLLLAVWFVGCLIAAAFAADTVWGKSLLVRIAFGIVFFFGIAILYSKMSDAESEENDLYKRIQELERQASARERDIDYLEERIEKVEHELFYTIKPQEGLDKEA